MAMTLCDEVTFEHIPYFVSKLSETDKNDILILFKDELNMVYGDSNICDWFISNITYLDRSARPLIEHLVLN